MPKKVSRPKSARRQRTFKRFVAAELHAMERLLKCAGGPEAGNRFTSDQAGLAAELEGILVSTGVCLEGGSPRQKLKGRIWAILAAAAPSPADDAKCLARALDADDPLARGALPRPLRAALISKLIPRLQARARRTGRNRAFERSKMDWSTMSELEREDVREVLRRMESYNRSRVRRGRPQKNDLDTALSSIAEVFVQRARLPIHEHDLPHAVRSRFISFAAIALAGRVYPASEADPEALSRRWRDVKRRTSTDAPP
jgi:hypothetical protein